MMMMMTKTMKHICTAGVFAVAYTREKFIVHSEKSYFLVFL